MLLSLPLSFAVFFLYVFVREWKRISVTAPDKPNSTEPVTPKKTNAILPHPTGLFSEVERALQKEKGKDLEAAPRTNLNATINGGLEIFEGLVLYIKKEGKFIKAYNNKGEDYTREVSSTKRKKALKENKCLKAKFSTNVNNKSVYWTLVENPEKLLKRKAKLIEKYGKRDGKKIFNKKITETAYLR